MRPEPARDEFDPFELRPDASLNRTTLAAIDGADEGWVGRRAFELLSLEALKQLCAEHAFADGPQGVEAVAAALAEAGALAGGGSSAPGARSPAPGAESRAAGTRWAAPGDESAAAGGHSAAADARSAAPGGESPVGGGESPAAGGESASAGARSAAPGGESAAAGGHSASAGARWAAPGGGSAAIGRAFEVCAEYGRRLAHLIASLITPGASAPWSPWRAAYLDYWSRIDHIWFGGGIAAVFGPELGRTVRAELARFGTRACGIDIAPHPEVLALLGAARTTPDPQSHVVAIDFGHTNVKRGVAIARRDSLERLELLPRLGAPSIDANPAPELVRAFVLDSIAETYRTALRHYSDVDPRIAVSLATYLTNGMPVDVYSLYRPLSGFTLEWVERELERRINSPVRLTFLHDGTAAARAVPAGGHTRHNAVIMLGTSLGVGFRPLSDAGLLPISPDLVVDDSS